MRLFFFNVNIYACLIRINVYHKKLFLSIIMTEYEIKQIQDYLNHKLKTDKFLAKKESQLTILVKFFLMMNL